LEGITLKSGGRLERSRWVYDEDAGKGEYVITDITNEAVHWLFERVQLADDVVLRDVFLLLAANPILFEVYRRDWAREITTEALRDQRDAESKKHFQQNIEYVEVYRHWERDSDENTLEDTDFLHFHGVGPVLAEDEYEHGHLVHRAGTRINWCVSLTSPAELAPLPLRVDPKVTVSESGTKSEQFGKQLDEVNCPSLQLGQLIHAIVWELSFHGPAPERETMAEDLLERVEAFKGRDEN
jgi:hypothetical protein